MSSFRVVLGLWCLTPLSTIFRLYRGGEFFYILFTINVLYNFHYISPVQWHVHILYIPCNWSWIYHYTFLWGTNRTWQTTRMVQHWHTVAKLKSTNFGLISHPCCMKAPKEYHKLLDMVKAFVIVLSSSTCHSVGLNLLTRNRTTLTPTKANRIHIHIS